MSTFETKEHVVSSLVVCFVLFLLCVYSSLGEVEASNPENPTDADNPYLGKSSAICSQRASKKQPMEINTSR